MLLIIVAILTVLAYVFCFALMKVSSNSVDTAWEDEQQIKYINDYFNKKL